MKSPRPQRILCVLGMHRSGTSCLTGSLQQGGLFLGKHHTWNDYNRKGNRENQDVVNLHEGILKSNGLNWKESLRPASWKTLWQHPAPVWQPQHIARAHEILAEYADQPLWGFKDPRTLMVLQGWRKLVPEMEFIGIYRHPMAVAQSLHSRRALPVSIEEGLQMWYNYNRELLRQYRRHPFPILCFDWSEERFHQRLDQLHRQLGLKPVPHEDRFYTRDLHKQTADSTASLPAHVRKLYEQLESISSQQ
ncbi:MAG TPA: sulfotransferase [Pseudomonadales bacterium]|nr:sulfotransferase [Pseudomonadales bacterium]